MTSVLRGRPRRPLLPDLFEKVPGGFSLDIPGPYKLEWTKQTAFERIHKFKDEPIPVTTGLVFAAAPFVIGAVGTRYAPIPMKPVFASMMVPTGVGEIYWFTVGYGVGKELERQLGL